VVTKLGEVSGPYRLSKLALLAGEDNYVTNVKQDGCCLDLDYSTVYWNTKLGSEHAKVVSSVAFDSIVYDMFGGVGPFAVPLAKKKLCEVFSNDLNTASYEFLQKNVDSNVPSGYGSVHCFNLDGREFVQTVVKNDLTQRITSLLESLPDSDVTSSSSSSSSSSCVLMNLPGAAVEFLDVFRSLLSDLPASVLLNKGKWGDLLPTVYCYSFIRKVDDLILKKDSYDNNEIFIIDGKEFEVFKSKRSKVSEEQTNVEKQNVNALSNSGSKISDDMLARLTAMVETALGCPVPQDFTVRYVRNVAPNKEMVCMNFKLWPDLVLGKC